MRIGSPIAAMRDEMPREYAKSKNPSYGMSASGNAIARATQTDTTHPQWISKMKTEPSPPTNVPPELPRKILPEAAKRALAEAEARRAAAAENAVARAKEFQGPKGPEPTRYGDWETKGIASDF
jgi:hypothetical protein